MVLPVQSLVWSPELQGSSKGLLWGLFGAPSPSPPSLPAPVRSNSWWFHFDPYPTFRSLGRPPDTRAILCFVLPPRPRIKASAGGFGTEALTDSRPTHLLGDSTCTQKGKLDDYLEANNQVCLIMIRGRQLIYVCFFESPLDI